MPAWPSRPSTVISQMSVAAAGDPGVEARRLGDDAGVGAHAAGDGGDPARAGLLLVGDRAHDELAGERGLGSASTSAATTIAATPPFMSQAPRP